MRVLKEHAIPIPNGSWAEKIVLKYCGKAIYEKDAEGEEPEDDMTYYRNYSIPEFTYLRTMRRPVGTHDFQLYILWSEPNPTDEDTGSSKQH